MADPGALVDAILRHRHFFARVENATVRTLLEPLEAALSETVEALSATLTTFQRARLTSTLGELRASIVEAYRSLGRDLPPSLAELAGAEATFQAEVLSRALGVSFDALPLSTLEHVIRQPVAGSTLAESLARQSADTVNALRISTSASILQGEGMPEAARRFSRAADVAESSAEGLVRTSILHASNAAALESYRAAGITTDTIVWLATLDERSCLACIPRDYVPLAQLHGQHPPLHRRCRCTVVPLVAIPGMDGGRARIPTRATADGPVRVKDYSAWFTRQSASFQQDVLGPSRYRLFTQGKLPLSSFSAGSDELSLDELKLRHTTILNDVLAAP